MEDKLIRKIQETDLFSSPGEGELAKRHEEHLKGMFKCPSCGKPTDWLHARPETTPYEVSVDPQGNVDMDNMDMSGDYDRQLETKWLFYCPKCGREVTGAITYGQ